MGTFWGQFWMLLTGLYFKDLTRDYIEIAARYSHIRKSVLNRSKP